MTIFKKLCLTSLITASLIACGITRADTCYDPDGHYYFACNVDPYGYPYEDDGVAFTFFFGSGGDYYNHGYYNHGYNHGGYNHHNNGWHNGGGHHH